MPWLNLGLMLWVRVSKQVCMLICMCEDMYRFVTPVCMCEQSEHTYVHVSLCILCIFMPGRHN